MDDYREQHLEMLNRFIAALKKGGNDVWFDEDEIVQIFDYAGDIGNDYLRAEALMWGARYFPDSKMLSERKCIFYNDVLDNEAVISYGRDNRDSTTLVTTLLYHKADGISGNEAKNLLESILKNTASMTDEEVIQLVNFAFDTNNKQWLYDHLNDVRKLTEFLPSLLFETAALSFEESDYERSIPLLEELVGEAPYCVDYWDMLTKAYFAAGREHEAREALDMTLAIDPEFLPALQIKAHTLAMDGKVDEIEQIQKIYPDDQEIAEAHLNALLFANKDNLEEKRDEIIDVLVLDAELFPQSDTFIDRLMYMAPDKAEPALNTIWANLRSYGTIEETTDQWKEWIEGLVAEDKYSGALVALEFYFSQSEQITNGATNGMRVTQALLYFATKQWAKAYNTISGNPSEAMSRNCMISVAEVISLLKMHRYNEAREVALRFIKSEKNYTIGKDDWTGVGQLSLVGLGLLMTDVLANTQAEMLSSFDADRYDPLHFWS